LWAWPYFEKPVSQNGIIKLYDAKSALLFRCIFREYYEVVADSDIGETLINFGDKPKDMQDKISDLPVFGDTIYSPELFSDPRKLTLLTINMETFLHIMYHVMMTSLSFLVTVRVTVQSVS
jgi:hypothetical protein